MKGKYLDPKADLTYRERVFYDDGYKKGQVAGRAEERLNNARSLKANGVPVDVIIKSLSLTKEETEQL